MDSIPTDVPIDPLVPFVYLKKKKLAQYVISYFMLQLGFKRMSPSSRLFRACHLVEMFREAAITGLEDPPTESDPTSEDLESDQEMFAD